jgi:hypothetical protein
MILHEALKENKTPVASEGRHIYIFELGVTIQKAHVFNEL